MKMPAVAFDYCFMRNAPNETHAVVLIGKDKRTKMFTAHVVPSKGTDFEWIAKQGARDLRKMGRYGPIVLRSDQ